MTAMMSEILLVLYVVSVFLGLCKLIRVSAQHYRRD